MPRGPEGKRVCDSHTAVCGGRYAKTQDATWQIFLVLNFIQLFWGKCILFIFFFFLNEMIMERDEKQTMILQDKTGNFWGISASWEPR